MDYPSALARLIGEFSRYPGIGPKTAERLAFHTLSREASDVRSFASALEEAMARIGPCHRCGGLAEEQNCPICLNPRRDSSKVCVVERAKDIYVFERSGVFDGLYHVLGGVISPLDGIGPEQLRIDGLLHRVREEGISEIILANNPSTEGETTGLYLAQTLEELDVRVSRIAYGVPLGSDLEYADPATLARAFQGRSAVKSG